MARRKQSRGTCTYCGQELTKSGMTKHLATCAVRQEKVAEADKKKSGDELLYHLRVEDAYSGYFWLDLEMRGSAALQKLDEYLRAIWLECCGQLSCFTHKKWSGDEIPMTARVGQVFGDGVPITHLYDFGTTSETLIKAVAVREGKPTTARPIALMARNNPPEEECMKCGKPAKWLCLECVYEHDESGLLCDKHAKNHPHDEYGEPMPLVNSPRMGMCGYTGPAEPPY